MIHEDLKACKVACHHCGVSLRVTVNVSKMHFGILHKLHCSGDTFRLLGVLIKPKLTMEDETVRILKKARPKIQAILKTRPFYDVAGVIQQFKSHVLCLLEQSAVAIYPRCADAPGVTECSSTEFRP